MTSEQHDRLSELFERAIELSSDERRRFVEGCTDDPVIRSELRSLLAAHERTPNLLERLAGDVVPAALVAIAADDLVGRQIGPYQIMSLLGAGGIGEVYRAHDTKLGRDVAIKILSDSLANDPDRLARFEREARTLASLNHPNIGQIHGFEDSDGIKALVMELVEGPTLADRIDEGPIPIDEALPIAGQIAEALEAAHEQGIIHRDLKPGNVKVRPDGIAKVLDFGLAKALESVSDRGADAATSRAIASPARITSTSVILGTAAYMSPEQARGLALDKRTDIWALGCVLFEMLTGRRAFEGSTLSDTLASVLKSEPDWTRLPTETPAPIHRLLRRLLERDPGRRLRDIGDVRIEIEDASQLPRGGAPIAAGAGAPRSPVWRRALPSAVSAIALAVAGLTLWASWHAARPQVPIRQVRVELGVDAVLETAPGPAVALSPDGSLLAFVAQKRATDTPELYIRRLDQLQASLLPGTSGARHPFFSPDGKWVAFFAEGELKKIPVTGGAAETLCDVPNDLGASWGDDDTIVFASRGSQGLFKVSSKGGNPTSLTALDQVAGERSHRWPQVLPTASAVLFTAVRVLDDLVVVRSLTTGESKVLARGHYARYLPSGHLIYAYRGTVFAAAFDVARLKVTGPPSPVLEDVAADAPSASAQYAFSGDGIFAYVPGGNSESGRASISWIDGSGHTQPWRILPGRYRSPKFSPDGGRLAIEVYDTQQQALWVYDWGRDMMSRLTLDAGSQVGAVWSPDGGIAYASRPTGSDPFNIYWRRPDGTGDVQQLTVSEHNQTPESWHPSGRILAFGEEHAETSWDIMILPIKKDEASGWKAGQPFPFLNSRFPEGHAAFSPDGRWLAYTSIESGNAEVYVRAFPGGGQRQQISSGGGMFPTWSESGNDLFYVTLDQRIMVSTYAVVGDSFQAGKRRLFAQEPLAQLTAFGYPSRSFTVHPDGNRVAILKATEPQPEANPANVVLVFNFFDELRRRAPASR